MVKKGMMLVLALVAVAAFARLGLAQENAASGPTTDVGTQATVFKVPDFPSASSINAYLVRATNLTVSGRDCCIGGDTWGIRAIGLAGFGSSTTTAETSPPGGCTPPTTGYSGVLSLPGWKIGFVIVKPVSTPGGFPAGMYMQFSSPGSVSVTQIRGTDECGL